MTLAHSNGLPSLALLWDFLEAPGGGQASPWIRLTSNDWLSACERRLELTPGALLRHNVLLFDSAAGKYLRVDGVLLPMRAYLSDYAQVCTRCLEEEPYLRAEWDLTHVTVCSRHGVHLVDRCPHCQSAIRFARPGLLSCPKCAFDFRRHRPRDADGYECKASQWAGAMAPFRFRWAEHQVVEPPEYLYGLWALLATDVQSVLALRSPSHPRLDRLAATAALGTVIRDDAVDGDALHLRLMLHVEHVSSTLGSEAARTHLEHLVSARDFLSPVLRAVAATGGYEEPQLAALRHFGGRPPRLLDETEARSFLGVDADTWQAVCGEVPICRPALGDGYDIDALVAARVFLSRMRPPGEIDAWLGYPGIAAALAEFNLIQTRRKPVPLEGMLDEAHLTEFLDRLRGQFGEGLSSTNEDEERVPQDLGPRALALLIADAMRGAFSTLRWKSPYTLRDFHLARAERASFLERVARLS